MKRTTLGLLALIALSGCTSMHVFDPAGLYVQADASWQAIEGDVRYYQMNHDRTGLTPYGGGLGHVTIGVEVPQTPTLSVDYGITHRSYLGIHDRGEERAFVGVKWRPFANAEQM